MSRISKFVNNCSSSKQKGNMYFDHTKSLIILRNKFVLLFGMALLLRGEELRSNTTLLEWNI